MIASWDVVWPFLTAYDKNRRDRPVWERVLAGVDLAVVGRLIADWNPAEHKGYPPRPADIKALAAAEGHGDRDLTVLLDAFPDGNRHFLADALAILRRHGQPVTAHAVSAFVARYPAWSAAIGPAEEQVAA